MAGIKKDLRHLIEGKDGRLSIRRICGAISFLVLMYVVVFSVHKNQPVQEGVLYALVTVIGGFFTLTTAQPIAEKFASRNRDQEI